MIFGQFSIGYTPPGNAWERKQAEEALLKAEHEQHEALLGALRAFGAEIPMSGEKLFQAFFSDQKKGGGR